MNKFAIDYKSLEQAIERPKFYRYADVEHKLVRVAYDIVRFNSPDEDIDTLWQVQATDDGDVIIAMYEDGGKIAEASADNNDNNSDWNVVADMQNNMNIFYKDKFIKRFAADKAGIASSDISTLCHDVSKKLNQDKSFRASLLEELPIIDRVDLFSNYPELTK